jgi:opacity protein-like surface antigen
LRPYLAAGLGATRFSASGPASDDEIRLSGSLALGLGMPVSENVALRVEARGYLTAVDSDSAFFCRSDNGAGLCRIVASGSTVGQVEVLAGIVFRF